MKEHKVKEEINLPFSVKKEEEEINKILVMHIYIYI